jgi:hypothetical protein
VGRGTGNAPIVFNGRKLATNNGCNRYTDMRIFEKNTNTNVILNNSTIAGSGSVEMSNLATQGGPGYLDGVYNWPSHWRVNPNEVWASPYPDGNGGTMNITLCPEWSYFDPQGNPSAFPLLAGHPGPLGARQPAGIHLTCVSNYIKK